MNLNQFSKRAKIISSDITKNTSRNVRKLALLTGSTLIQETPVDTGQARLNWQAQIDSPNNTKIDGGGTSQEAINKISSNVASFDILRNVNIWITNNLPYINRLNQGYSAQAPAGFVETAVLNANRAISKLKVLK